MAVPQTFAAAFFSAVIIAAAGCAGGPKLARAVTVHEGSQTTVQLMNFRAGDTQVLTLQNLSSIPLDDSGKPPQLPAKTKVVPDAMLQELLDYYAGLGLFAGAGNRVPTEARSAILVTAAGQRFAFHGRGPSQERNNAYAQAFSLFFRIFNGASGYHQAGVRDSFRDGSEQDANHRQRGGNSGRRAPSGGKSR